MTVRQIRVRGRNPVHTFVSSRTHGLGTVRRLPPKQHRHRLTSSPWARAATGKTFEELLQGASRVLVVASGSSYHAVRRAHVEVRGGMDLIR
jgi:hypothetical protein